MTIEDMIASLSKEQRITFSRAVLVACIMARVSEKFPHRRPTKEEIFQEADAWLKDFREAVEKCS